MKYIVAVTVLETPTGRLEDAETISYRDAPAFEEQETAMNVARECLTVAHHADPKKFGAAKWELVGKVHKFNTGRLYAAEGQPIVWAVFKSIEPYEQCVVFRDRARMIEGTIRLHFGNLGLVDDRWVLRAYDDHHWHYNGELQNMLMELTRA